MMVRELTPELARRLELSARDRAEITRTHPDLEQWARERCALPGVAWALIAEGKVQVIGGVIDRAGVGAMWIAGREGWTRYVKHALRVFAEIKAVGFKRLECRAYADNHVAQGFAERLGFVRLKLEGNLVHYGMAPC